MTRTLATMLVLAPALAHAAEPDAPGSHAVTREVYELGDDAFVPPSLGAPVELAGVIHRPTDLAMGPFPLVVALHGRHSTCFDPDIPIFGDPFANASQEWPCFPNHEPVPSLEGYDYWADRLASHGYIVVSIGANGIAAADDAVDDGGAAARAELIAAHLELWTAFDETDEYGTTYNGAVDLSNVGLLGHSRGGEGVAAWFELAAERGLPQRVNAALLLAPTDFNRNAVTGVPLAAIVPYCDGDVFDLQGVHYFDDSRHALPGDPAPKYVFEMAGSNHNFYNTIWSPGTFEDGGAVDDFTYLASLIGSADPSCSDDAMRLDEVQQQRSFVAYANAFFRTHLGGETEYVELLRGDAEPPAAAAAVRTTYMPGDRPIERLMINRVDGEGSLATNDLGGTVTAEGVARYRLCGVGPDGGVEDYEHCVEDPGQFMGDLFEGRQPHVPGLAHLRLGFDGPARWINELPEGTDASALLALQLRAVVDVEDVGGDAPAGFSIALVDRAGTRATVGPRAWSDALPVPAGGLYPIAPKLLLHGIRVPLANFLADAPALALDDLASVELAFDAGSGAIIVSDLAFVDELPPLPSGTESSGSESGVVDDSGSGGATDGSTTDASTTAIATTGDVEGTSGSSDDSAGATPSDDGCGCNDARPHGAWMLPLLLLMRRRER